MEEKKIFGLFVWINDDPITGNVLNMKSVVEPRKPLTDYKVGDRVLAKCPGFGIQTGVIGKISDETGKKELDQILVGEEFKELVASVFGVAIETTDNDTGKSGDNMDRNDVTVEMPRKDEKKTEVGKKRIHPDDVSIEAKQAKVAEKREKREREKERNSTNLSISEGLIGNNTMERKMDILLNKVTSITSALQSIQAQQQLLEAKVDNLTEMANCPKCLRTKYKLVQRDSRELAMRSPVSKNTLSTSPQPSREQPNLASQPAKEPPSFLTSQSSQNSQEDIHFEGGHFNTQKEAEPEESGAQCGLSYLGDSQFGIKVAGERLTTVKACSKDITKMALNLIELLVTPEECKNNLTVYGEGKGKTALDTNKRKALRSELFNNFYVTAKEEEKAKIWNETVVPKVNNKIRGIRNDKYKLKL